MSFYISETSKVTDGIIITERITMLKHDATNWVPKFSGANDLITLQNYEEKKNQLGMTELHNRICNMNPEDFEKLVNGLSQKQLFDLQGPRIAAHRGRGVNAKPIGWPENTLAAAKAAIKQFDASDKYGGHAIECDIHVTADGYAILVHGPIAENYCVVDSKPKDSKQKSK